MVKRSYANSSRSVGGVVATPNCFHRAVISGSIAFLSQLIGQFNRVRWNNIRVNTPFRWTFLEIIFENLEFKVHALFEWVKKFISSNWWKSGRRAKHFLSLKWLEGKWPSHYSWVAFSFQSKLCFWHLQKCKIRSATRLSCVWYLIQFSEMTASSGPLIVSSWLFLFWLVFFLSFFPLFHFFLRFFRSSFS